MTTGGDFLRRLAQSQRCALCKRLIRECKCPEREGTRCDHSYPCGNEKDSDYE